jgi:signal transduction histidine kinase
VAERTNRRDPAEAAPPRTADQLTSRVTSAMRLVLGTAAPLIYAIDPADRSGTLRPFAAAVLVLFFAYSAAVHVATVRGWNRISPRLMPWIDLGWVTLLIAFSEGTSSIFFSLYLFAVLCAAFQGGFRAGIAIVVGAFLSFSVIGGLTTPLGPSFELDRSLIRPLYLLVLGYLISWLGEHELRQRSRLTLLREVVALANPRFGAGHMIARLVGKLRQFYRAETCRIVVEDEGGAYWMRTAARDAPVGGPAVVLPPEVARVLLPAPETASFLCTAPLAWRRASSSMQVIDGLTGAHQQTRPCSPLAVALEARSFVSVPFALGGGSTGRLYLTSRRRDAFDVSDVQFLTQVAEQVLPMLEKVRIVDQLATAAAEEERQRIARDIHDSVVQPFVGFGMGLGAVRDALASGRTEQAREMVDRLVDLTADEVTGLRSYVRGLRSGERLDGDSFAGSVRRFCERFSSVTGIHVDLVTEGGGSLEPRVAGEAIQIVAEALSNVRRHTEAATAKVRIATTPERLVVQVENPAPQPPLPFSPRSLTERAEALGGGVAIQLASEQRTAVRVEIPL